MTKSEFIRKTASHPAIIMIGTALGAALLLMAGFAWRQPVLAGGAICLLVRAALTARPRPLFYAVFGCGMIFYSFYLSFFYAIFGPAGGFVLCGVLALWLTAPFLTLNLSLRLTARRLNLAIFPLVWTGFEYFRSEAYPLKFAYLTLGTFAPPHARLLPYGLLGVYGIGGLFVLAAVIPFFGKQRFYRLISGVSCGLALILLTLFLYPAPDNVVPDGPRLTGVQVEFPSFQRIKISLDYMRTKFPDTDIFVFPEYSTGGRDFSRGNPVFDHISSWCRSHGTYVIIGAMQTLSPRPLADNRFFNTAFVIGPDGEIAFKQVKSVPIQFFTDGGPALERRVWQSPFGRIGFAICYDFAFTQVMDDVVGQGADLIVVPSLDARDWGERAHEVLASIPPFRARSYRIPVFRVVSSGISQAITPQGITVDRREFGNMQAIIAWQPLLQQGRVPIGHLAASLLAKLSLGWGVVLIVWYSLRKNKEALARARRKKQNPATLHTEPPGGIDGSGPASES